MGWRNTPRIASPAGVSLRLDGSRLPSPPEVSLPLRQDNAAPVHDGASGPAAELPTVEGGIAGLAAEGGGLDRHLLVRMEEGDVRRTARLQRASWKAQDSRRADGEQLDQPFQADEPG